MEFSVKLTVEDVDILLSFLQTYCDKGVYSTLFGKEWKGGDVVELHSKLLASWIRAAEEGVPTKPSMSPEMVKLNWELLEHRLRYYELDAPIIPDTSYDALEAKFLNYCTENGFETCLSTMVGVDWNSPAVQSAWVRLQYKL